MGRPKSKFSQSQLEEMGKKVEEIRKETGLSQQKFAEKIGYQQQIISAIEKGKKPVSMGIAEQIEEAFGYRAAYLLGYDDFPTTSDMQKFYDETFEKAFDEYERDHILSDILKENGYSFSDIGFELEDTKLDENGEMLEYDVKANGMPPKHRIKVIKDGSEIGEIFSDDEKAIISEVKHYAEFLLMKYMKGASDNGE
ncbi:MAG: helix-turn-helix transcriptional regulator [Eubacteriales bacterium]|nr:helix-turn-helix transcriptional regulator [Eubacteriales bacterium]